MAGEGSSWFPAQALYCPNQSALQSAVWCLVHCIALPAPHLQDLGNLSKPWICFPHFPMWKTSPWWLTWLHQQQHWRIQPPKCITERLIMWFIWEVALWGPQPFLFQNSLHVNFFINVFGCHLSSHKATCPVALETSLSLLQKKKRRDMQKTHLKAHAG